MQYKLRVNNSIKETPAKKSDFNGNIGKTEIYLLVKFIGWPSYLKVTMGGLQLLITIHGFFHWLHIWAAISWMSSQGLSGILQPRYGALYSF